MDSFPDDAYAQDIITPTRVEHRVEFGDRSSAGSTERHAFGYWYDFLVYEFVEGSSRAEAVRYLDEDDVTLRVIHPGDLTSEFAMRVLLFLTMRYEQVYVPTDDGYAPMDARLQSRVSELWARHLTEIAIP